MEQVNIESSVCRFLRDNHTGRKNAASSRTLEAVFHVKGSEVRKIINSLRCTGHPVCSDSTGYYYAATQDEVNATIAQLNSRITKISNARNGLLAGRNQSSLLPIRVDVGVNLYLKGVD